MAPGSFRTRLASFCQSVCCAFGDRLATHSDLYPLRLRPRTGIPHRLSVKREGVVSSFLHDCLREGDLIEARAPDGSFVIDAAERRPAALLAAGIGVTPLLAMLRHIVYEGIRTRRFRSTWFFYVASIQSRPCLRYRADRSLSWPRRERSLWCVCSAMLMER